MSGALKPVRARQEVIEAVSVWNIGSTGAHTKTSGVAGEGFDSVARTAAGSYTITHTRGVPVGPFLGYDVQIFRTATSAAALIPKNVLSAYTAETAAAAATGKYETWDAATPTKTELSSGDKVVITARWLKTS